MKLSRAAGMADTVTATDAYGTATFLCQYDPLSYSKIDGTSVKKRMVSATPSVLMPARGAITIDGQTYLVGHGAPDYWKNQRIRVNYVIQGADGLANLHSIDTALASTTPTTAYAALAFSKYLPEVSDNSRMPPQYQVFLAGSETAPADSLVQLGGVWFLVKQSYLSTSGLRVALANELAEPVFETVSFGARTYDPITDGYTSSGTSVKILRVKWSEHYLYLSKASETYERGDMQVFMLKASTPKPSDTLTLSDGVWRVLSVQDETTHWSCHVRRA